ncbi:hypothetical protein ACIRRA_10230 [Nocardia sp. NPDC101769]|uniref:hypothetical protein n=1 Tax=Nocardia sp. NPDC101769 TaxID=3364333 RepID=UPI00382FDBAD
MDLKLAEVAREGHLLLRGQRLVTEEQHLVAILDGYPVGQMQSRFPVIESLIDQARTQHADDQDAALAVANVAAFTLGRQLFEPFLRNAAGLDDMPNEQLRHAIGTEAASILRGPLPGPTTASE